jgi:hypothetical protein
MLVKNKHQCNFNKLHIVKVSVKNLRVTAVVIYRNFCDSNPLIEFTATKVGGKWVNEVTGELVDAYLV